MKKDVGMRLVNAVRLTTNIDAAAMERRFGPAGCCRKPMKGNCRFRPSWRLDAQLEHGNEAAKDQPRVKLLRLSYRISVA